jgi:YidC/Oxa1 family membrane protein insertase
LDFLLPYWNPLIVHPLEQGLRFLAAPLEGVMSPGLAGGLAIILFTIILRLILLPLTLIQVRSQRHQMQIQPELKELQRRYKGDREGLAREQMKLYKERGVNPMAGCIPLLIQLPILFGMYSAMQQLATTGLTLDQVTANSVTPGQVLYAAERYAEPLPYNQFVLTRLEIIPKSPSPMTFEVPQDQAEVSLAGKPLLSSTVNFTLTPGQAPGNINPPSVASGAAAIFFRAGALLPDGTYDHTRAPVVGELYTVEVWVDASGTNADSARATIVYDPTLLDLTHVDSPQLQDVAFKSRFLWLPSLGQPDVFHVAGLSIPGFMLIVMTLSSYLTQRMTTLPTEDPQQQAMMRSMAFMPLMYLFFFLNTPSGLVLYWLTSNLFSMIQQYFTVGLGLLGGDLERFTGRDLQPSWASIRQIQAQARNGRADGASGSSGAPAVDDTSVRTTPALDARAAGSARRPRPQPGKGRKRGKR